MLISVKEDSGRRVPRSRERRNLVVWCATAFTMVASARFDHRADAQAPPVFKATVLDTSASSQRVSVTQYRSVTVETTVEVATAVVTASHIADVQVVNPKRLYITGKTYGHTTINLVTSDQKQFTLDVSVELDLAQLNEALRAVDPLAQVQARSVMGNVLLTGRVSNAAKAQRMVDVAGLFLPRLPDGRATSTSVQNYLDVAGEQQVLLRCVVAEVNRAAVRELGVNGFLAGENFRDGFLVNQIGGINPINIGAAADANVRNNIPFLTGTDGIPLGEASTLSLGFPRAQMQTFIRALADNSLLNILAEPNLVAISGETASFLAGGEFPIPVPQGNQQVTIEFREFGVRMNFTPVVLGQQMVRLRVAPEVSELDFSTSVQIEGFVVPGLTSRATETTVELGSGQTIAIAGLLNEQTRGVASRIPGIGEVPILGALFRSTNFRRSLTELVILVTPEIVAPLDPHQVVTLPGRDTGTPNDLELYGLGRIEARRATAADNTVASAEATPTQAAGAPAPVLTSQDALRGPWGYASAAETPQN